MWLLFWIIWRDKFLFIPLIAVAFSSPFTFSSFAININHSNIEKDIKIMSWNVKNFDLYNWSRNASTRAKMLQIIADEKPAIICFQEFYTDNGMLFNNIKYLTDTLGYKYHYFQPTTQITRLNYKKHCSNQTPCTIHQKWGVAIFSNYPIIDTGRIDFANSKNNECIYTDLLINGKTCRIYSVHFQSLRLGNSDYAILDSLEIKLTADWKSLSNVARKMKRAYSKRALQASAVAQSVNNHSGIQIVCGDFNDVPVSYTYQTVKGNMNDAFVQKGNGFGHTYVTIIPAFRIDYALFHPSLQINSYKSIRKELSDHYPVIVTFSY